MIKILFFEIDVAFGGIESFLLNVLKNVDLHDMNVQFDFVTSAEKPAELERFTKAGVHIVHVSSKKNFSNYYKDLNILFTAGNYYIVHIQKNSLSNALPLYFAQKYKVPYILHAQNSAPSSSNFIFKMLHYFNRTLFARNATIKLACGTTAAKWMFNSLDGVKIIKNGINPSEFKRDNGIRLQMREKYHVENGLVLCNVGRFTNQKNHRFIIETFRELHKHKQNTKLFLVGDGANFEEVKKQVQELGLEDSVVFFGSLEREVESKVLMASDVFLMPSLYEGVSIASVEAQMAGLRLFVSDTVDKDTNITGNVTFLSLEDPPSKWAETILNSISAEESKYQYNDLLKKIRKAGYDMKYTTDMLMEIYTSDFSRETR